MISWLQMNKALRELKWEWQTCLHCYQETLEIVRIKRAELTVVRDGRVVPSVLHSRACNRCAGLLVELTDWREY